MRFVVVQDHKENRRKCTLTPLEAHPDFSFVRLGHPVRSPEGAELGSGVLLHVDGELLARDDAGLLVDGSLVIVDSTWVRVPKVLARMSVRPGATLERRRLPPGVVTAYPRTSKLHADPTEGLASIEALFTATLILGEPRLDLLQHYRWGGEFLSRNEGVFASWRAARGDAGSRTILVS